jgi:hypothetical protein
MYGKASRQIEPDNEVPNNTLLQHAYTAYTPAQINHMFSPIGLFVLRHIRNMTNLGTAATITATHLLHAVQAHPPHAEN